MIASVEVSERVAYSLLQPLIFSQGENRERVACVSILYAPHDVRGHQSQGLNQLKSPIKGLFTRMINYPPIYETRLFMILKTNTQVAAERSLAQ